MPQEGYGLRMAYCDYRIQDVTMSNQIRICLATAALLAAQLQSASAQLPPQQGELAICRGFAAGYTVVVQRYPGGEYVYVTANGQVAINKVTDDMAGARNRQHVADELREFTLKTPTGYTARL
jgi:hypothetical protein